MKNLSVYLLLVVSIFLLAHNAPAQARGQGRAAKIPVKFAKGATSAKVKGKVFGYDYVDYIVGAKSGQIMSVKLKSTNPACNFSMLYSNGKNVGDAMEVTDSTQNLDADDNYVIRVLLPRSSARRKETANFTVQISVK